MNLIRDCLDKQLVDLNNCNMGKCDGIVMKTRGEDQPEITYIEIGAVTQARRIHPRFGRWIEAVSKRWRVADQDPFRVPWSKVVMTGVTITIGVDAEKTPALAWEQWLRRNVIGRIPGA